MMECIDELLANDCPDMTVCGNNCASAHNVSQRTERLREKGGQRNDFQKK